MKEVATMVHPAWVAVEQRLTDNRRWIARVAGRPAGYADWQIALAMAVAGFGDDLTIVPGEDGAATQYGFPPYRIVRDDDDDDLKPVNPDISPRALMEFYTRNDPLGAFDDGLRHLRGAAVLFAPATRVAVNGNGVHK